MLEAGVARLRRCAAGEDFIQARPKTAPGGDLTEWYIREFGRIINSDCAKFAFLGAGYEPGDPESVRKFYPPASELVRQLIEKMLQSAAPGGRLYLSAGGNGSGKSSFCSAIRPLLGENEWVIDATLGSYEPTRRTISRAEAKGMTAVVFWIKRTPEAAWRNGVLKRDALGGHITPRDIFDSTHAIVPQNVAKLKSDFSSTTLTVIEIENDFPPHRESK